MSNVSPPIRNLPNASAWLEFIRNQFGPDSNWKRNLNQSGLPESIRQMIETVVRESRLMRFEKSAVTNELISHFLDGSQRGATFDSLANEFGEPAVTALLIRRSKIRNRPIMMKFLRLMGMGVGLLLLSYVGLAAYFHMGTPNPSHDYAVDFNAPIADLDDEERAWTVYRPLWTKYGFSEGGGFDTTAIFTTDEEGVQELVRPSDPEWEGAKTAMADWRDLMDGFRVGARLPHLGLPLYADSLRYSDEDFAAMFPHQSKEDLSHGLGIEGWDEEMDELMKGNIVGMLLPHVQVMRRAGRMFIVDTRIAIEEGDSDRATDNIKTMFGIAEHASEGNCLVCSLVGFAISQMGFICLEETLEEHPGFLSEEQLASIQKRVNDLDVRGMLKLDGERIFFEDLVQRAYTDDGNGDGRMTPEGVKVLMFTSWMVNQQLAMEVDSFTMKAMPVVAPASLFVFASRKDLLEKYDEIWETIKTDSQQTYSAGTREYSEEEVENLPLKYQMISMLLPAAQQVLGAMDRTLGRKEAVIAALAIHRYKLKHGEWPIDYDQVSPEFATEFPIDEVDGSLLKFRFDGGQLLVYSVGNDLDDDGGVDRVDMHGHVQDRGGFIFGQKGNVEGDWIVWPQRDGLSAAE